MTRSRVILCGGAAVPGPTTAAPVVLDLHGSAHNVNLRISDISRAMASAVPEVLLDLIEMATYVYAADQSVGRGGSEDLGGRWRRHFEFHVAVRQPQRWSAPAVATALSEALSLLSEDDYDFHFANLSHRVPMQLYFENLVPEFDADEVMLFSGGLDSLAGAIDEAAVGGRRVALVSHRSAPKRKRKVEDLARNLRTRHAPHSILHVPVWANKDSGLGREYTQRTRSFLYAALAAAVATMLGRSRIRFYENGVTSLNFPISPQVIGARATRTTHPQVIEKLQDFFSALLEKHFEVENPFIWKTKADVIRLIRDQGCGDLIPLTVSCSRTVAATKIHTHCGECSQCIDRRFAALAAGAHDDDPAEMYKVDLFKGERVAGGARTMVESYVRIATEVAKMSDNEFFARFGEASRVVRHVGLPAHEAGIRIVDLYRRHSRDIERVLVEELAAHASELHDGSLPDSCLAVLAVNERYRESPTAGPTTPTFRREAGFWRIWFENEAAPALKDTRGLRHLARLLASPGRSVHSIQLLAHDAGVEDPRAPAASGDVVDEKTIRGCVARLREVRKNIEEAERNNERGRVQRLGDKEEALNNYLATVSGQDGRPRRDGGDAEYARKAVSAAISRAMTNLRRHHRGLWLHLKSALKPGVYCVYGPDPLVRWIT